MQRSVPRAGPHAGRGRGRHARPAPPHRGRGDRLPGVARRAPGRVPRPGSPPSDLRGPSADRCPKDGEDPRAVVDALVAAVEPGPRRDGLAALLRVRHRGVRAGRARGGLADLDLGAERRAVPGRAGRLGRRGGRRRLARRAARPPGRDLGRVHDRGHDGQLSRRSPRPVTRSSGRPAGTSRRTGSRVPRRSTWSWAPTSTPRSSMPSAWSVWADAGAIRVATDDEGRMRPAELRRTLGELDGRARRSCAPRPAR